MFASIPPSVLMIGICINSQSLMIFILSIRRRPLQRKNPKNLLWTMMMMKEVTYGTLWMLLFCQLIGQIRCYDWRSEMVLFFTDVYRMTTRMMMNELLAIREDYDSQSRSTVFTNKKYALALFLQKHYNSKFLPNLFYSLSLLLPSLSSLLLITTSFVTSYCPAYDYCFRNWSYLQDKYLKWQFLPKLIELCN